jgi:hypothetical protein
MKSFGAVFPGNESNPSPTPKTNFIWNFSLGALISSRQQILHHAFKLPLQGNGNKSFAIPSRFLKTMATNPLPFLQGFLKQWPALGTFWKVLERDFLMKSLCHSWQQIFPHSFQGSHKQFPMKLWCHYWQQILHHAFNIPENNFLWNCGANLGNKSFAMPSRFLKTNSYQILVPFLAPGSFTPSRFLKTISYEIDLATILSNKYFPISLRVHESNFLVRTNLWSLSAFASCYNFTRV